MHSYHFERLLQQTYLIVVGCLVHVDEDLHCRGGVGMLSLRSGEAALGVGTLPPLPSDPLLVSTDDAAPITIGCYEKLSCKLKTLRCPLLSSQRSVGATAHRYYTK